MTAQWTTKSSLLISRISCETADVLDRDITLSIERGFFRMSQTFLDFQTFYDQNMVIGVWSNLVLLDFLCNGAKNTITFRKRFRVFYLYSVNILLNREHKPQIKDGRYSCVDSPHWHWHWTGHCSPVSTFDLFCTPVSFFWSFCIINLTFLVHRELDFNVFFVCLFVSTSIYTAKRWGGGVSHQVILSSSS